MLLATATFVPGEPVGFSFDAWLPQGADLIKPGAGLPMGVSLSGGNESTLPTVFYPSAASSRSAEALAIRPGLSVTDIDLTILQTKAVTLSGHLPDPGAGRMTIRLLRPGASEPVRVAAEVGLTITDGTGRFTFSGVTPGEYVLLGLGGRSAAMDRWVLQEVTVGEDGLRDVAVVPQRGTRVSGAWQPAPQGSKAMLDVWLERTDGLASESGGNVWGQVHVPQPGQFATGVVPPGEYILRAVASGQQSVNAIINGTRSSGDVLIDLTRGDAAGIQLVLSDQATYVEGAVRNNGRPSASSYVLLVNTDALAAGSMPSQTALVYLAQVSPEGRFRLGSLPFGNYSAIAVTGWPQIERALPYLRTGRRIAVPAAGTYVLELELTPIR